MMLSARARRSLGIQAASLFVFSTCFGLLLSVLANDLTVQRQWLIWVLVIGLVAGLIGLVLFLRTRDTITVAINTPRTIRSPHDASLYARRGFVGFVPPFRPQNDSPAQALAPDAIKQAITRRDFDLLHLEKSNLQPAIAAILSHKPRLEHCWLLSTVAKDMRGSLDTANFLADYLRIREGVSATFHVGTDYTIELTDDAVVLTKTFDQVQQVFKEAGELKLGSSELVADITSGWRSMALGMVLASLDKDRDIEFVGTRYNDCGDPTQDLLLPIIFSFEPVLAKRD